MNSASESSGYRYYALALLFAANMLNYIDRQALYAVFPLISDDFKLSDTALGSLGSAFMICYMTVAPLFGWIGDRVRRARLAASGLVFWSFATVAAGFSTGYASLMAARAMVGVGEASFGAVSPGLLADFFARTIRGRILSFFYLAIPVGSAMGYALGGLLGHSFGWQAAFFVVGAPGLLLAIPLWLLKEPPKGVFDGLTISGRFASCVDYKNLFFNRSFVFNTASMTAMTFALGGLAQWFPTYLYRAHNLDVGEGNLMFGLVTIAAGVSGTVLGGLVGDYWQKKNSGGYLYVAGLGFFVAVPAMAAALIADTYMVCLGAVFVAEFFLFLSTGPQNTVIINVTSPSSRAMAFAVNIFVIHALGDAISPLIIGAFSDAYGLRTALFITPGAVLLASAFSFYCAKFISGDMAKIRT